MNYLIIVIVVLVGLSPIFWMMPSPKQKRLMQLRQTAMALGFQIKVVDLPQTHRQIVRQEPLVQGVVYRLPWIKKKSTSPVFEHLLIRAEVESSSSDMPTIGHSLLAAALEVLPKTVMAIEYATTGVAAYWREQGGDAEVELMHQQLSELRRTLQTRNLIDIDERKK